LTQPCVRQDKPVEHEAGAPPLRPYGPDLPRRRQMARSGQAHTSRTRRHAGPPKTVRPLPCHGTWSAAPAFVSQQLRAASGPYTSAGVCRRQWRSLLSWTEIRPALSAWELACHALPNTVFAAESLFALSVSARYRPSQTVPSGTRRARLWLPNEPSDYWIVTPTYVPMQNLGGLGECCPSYAGSERRSGLASTVALGLELPIQTSGELLRGRPSCLECCRPTFAFADNERSFGLACMVAAGLELPTQTSGERLRGRPSCPTRCHLTSVAGHVMGQRGHRARCTQLSHPLPGWCCWPRRC
jgi:hypothetical protein